MEQNNAVIKQYTVVMEQKNSAMKQKIVALERNKAAFRQNREKNPDFPKINFLDSKPAGSNRLARPPMGHARSKVDSEDMAILMVGTVALR